MVYASQEPGDARERVLPTGEPVLVTMPGSPWAGFVGTVDYYLGDSVVVCIQTSAVVTDGPPRATVPARWVRSLAEVLGFDQAPAEGRSAPHAAGTDDPSPEQIG